MLADLDRQLRNAARDELALYTLIISNGGPVSNNWEGDLVNLSLTNSCLHYFEEKNKKCGNLYSFTVVHIGGSVCAVGAATGDTFFQMILGIIKVANGCLEVICVLIANKRLNQNWDLSTATKHVGQSLKHFTAIFVIPLVNLRCNPAEARKLYFNDIILQEQYKAKEVSFIDQQKKVKEKETQLKETEKQLDTSNKKINALTQKISALNVNSSKPEPVNVQNPEEVEKKAKEIAEKMQETQTLKIEKLRAKVVKYKNTVNENSRPANTSSSNISLTAVTHINKPPLRTGGPLPPPGGAPKIVTFSGLTRSVGGASGVSAQSSAKQNSSTVAPQQSFSLDVITAGLSKLRKVAPAEQKVSEYASPLRQILARRTDIEPKSPGSDSWGSP